jgi:ATP synthase protein I
MAVTGRSTGEPPGVDGASAYPAHAGEPEPIPDSVDNGMEHFQRLRRRLLISTLLASSAAVPACWLLFDLTAAVSLLVGSIGGLLYLVLLARSVSRLGGDKRSVGKIQLLVPVVLVLASARIPQLELVPALVGFLLYKPALLVQAYLDR